MTTAQTVLAITSTVIVLSLVAAIYFHIQIAILRFKSRKLPQ